MSRAYKSGPGSLGLGGMFKTITKTIKSSLSQPGPSQVQPTIVGGAPDLHSVLDKLGSENSVPDRITAAENILSSINTYSVSSIPEIWLKAQDMINPTNSPECRRAGLKLMIVCIQFESELRGARISFYESIVESSNVQDFELQLLAMRSLTKEGTDAEDFFQGKYRLPKVLDNWFRILLKESLQVRGGKTDPTPLWGGSPTEGNFYEFLYFTISVFKHNHFWFEENDIVNLIDRIGKTCRRTTKDKDIEISLDLLDTIKEHSSIPIKIFPVLIEVLCLIVVGVKSAENHSWKIIESLANSNISNYTFYTLLRILQTNNTDILANILQGAVRAVQKLVIVSVETDRALEFSIDDILFAYNRSLWMDSLMHTHEIISCIYELLANEKVRTKFFTYDIWKSEYSPLEIVFNAVEKNSTLQKAASNINWLTSSSAISTSSKVSQISSKSIQLQTMRLIVEKLNMLFSLIADIFEDSTYFCPRDRLIDFFNDMSMFVDNRCAILVINHFRKSQYCHPLSSLWIQNTNLLVQNFYKGTNWDSTVRIPIINLICDVYVIAKEMSDISPLLTLLDFIFDRVEEEYDSKVLEVLIEKFIEISQDSPVEIMDHIAKKFLVFFPSADTNNNYNRRRSTGSSIASSLANELSITSSATPQTNVSSSLGATTTPGSPSLSVYDTDYQVRRLVAVGFCKVFIKTFRTSALKARSIFYSLITILKRSMKDPITFIEVARLLCRIRATTEGYIYLNIPTNMDGLSASVGRNINIYNPSSAEKSSMLWWYPESPSFISEEDFNIPSSTLKRHSEETFENQRLKGNEYEIDISLWFNEVLGIFENGANWEIYSFVWAHFGPQLSNLELFITSGSDIHRLRQIICEQLSTSKLPNVDYGKDITRSDLLITIVRTISSLIAYHDMFTKKDEDYIVQALVQGLSSSWEKTAVSCIHSLVVCCHELPLSIKKYLGQIFTRFQTKITHIGTSPHILEFLLSLSRLPTLVDNFTQDEYKRVFGMAFKYIQDAYTLSKRPEPAPYSPETRIMSPIASPMGGDPNSNISSSDNKQLPQYLLSLAYNVVATWFLTLKVEERKYLAKFITRNLILAEGTKDTIDLQSMAYIDLIARFTYSDLDLTVQTTITLPSVTDNNRTSKQWIYGNSIISIDTDKQTGETYIVVRRPTGTTMLTMKPDEKVIPRWLEEAVLQRNDPSVNLESQRLREEIPTAFTPNYFLLQVMYPTDSETMVKPIPLPNDQATSRAIAAFDRTPVVDFHKVGILYLGPGQQDEHQILSNQVGSPSYRRFLQSLGKLVRLKDNKKIYTGGLDTSNDIDGEYAYVWSDKVTQMIFHTTTLMPSPANPQDTSYSSKKRHIGNDFINIYFDDSELPFKFDVIKSQFNFINIVITPVSINFSKHKIFTKDEETPVSPIIKPVRTDMLATKTKEYYKVRAYCKPGVPAIFAACHLKIISEDSLAGFVRNLALISSKFATVWNSGGEYKSHWQYRLQQINTLRAKVTADSNKSVPNHQSQANHQGHQRGDSIDKKEVGQSFLDQLTAGNTSGSGGPGIGTNESVDSSDKRDSSINGGFVMEDLEEPDFPLLKALEFNSFT